MTELDEVGRRGHYGPGMRSGYRFSRAIPPEVGRLIAEKTQIDASTRVLDVGTGAGELALQMARFSSHVTGIDSNPAFIRIAQQNSEHSERPINFIRHSGNMLPLAAPAFDVVIASQVLHWLRPIAGPVGLLKSLARPGALWFVETKLLLEASHPLHKVFGMGSLSYSDVISDCNRQILAHKTSVVRAAKKAGLTYPDLCGAWTLKGGQLFGLEYAKSYIFPDTVRRAVPGPETWIRKLEKIFQQYEESALYGTMIWLAVMFRYDSET